MYFSGYGMRQSDTRLAKDYPDHGDCDRADDCSVNSIHQFGYQFDLAESIVDLGNLAWQIFQAAQLSDHLNLHVIDFQELFVYLGVCDSYGSGLIGHGSILSGASYVIFGSEKSGKFEHMFGCISADQDWSNLSESIFSDIPLWLWLIVGYIVTNRHTGPHKGKSDF